MTLPRGSLSLEDSTVMVIGRNLADYAHGGGMSITSTVTMIKVDAFLDNVGSVRRSGIEAFYESLVGLDRQHDCGQRAR